MESEGMGQKWIGEITQKIKENKDGRRREMEAYRSGIVAWGRMATCMKVKKVFKRGLFVVCTVSSKCGWNRAARYTTG